MASRSWNRVELIGNLTRDPELRYTPNGAAVCTFGMATNRTYVSEGEKKEEVDFHRIVSWNKLAEICNQFLKKGTKVFASGRLQYREWEPQEGQRRREAEIVMEDMIILSPKTTSEVMTVDEDLAVSEPKVSSAPKAEEEKKEPEESKESKEPVKSAGERDKGDKSKTEPQTPNEEVEDLPF